MAAGWGSNTWGQTGWGRSLYDAARAEPIALADAYSATIKFAEAVAESFGLTDTNKFTHLDAVSEALTLADVLRSNTTWGEEVDETLAFGDSTSQRLLWELIDETQDPGWTLINTRP